MRKLLIIIIVVGVSLIGKMSVNMCFAQVDNYCLHFTGDDGVVNCGKITEVNPDGAYTLQFWFCPDVWLKGASLVRAGGFSIKLGNEHALVFNDGSNYITVTDSHFATNVWAHVTMRVDQTTTVISVNNDNEFTLNKHLVLPVRTYSLWLGGDYRGRLDEVRLWKVKLKEDYNSFYNNTLNKYAPQWSTLAAYYKLDQELCPNVVDYKGKHHATMSGGGVKKELVDDNEIMRYRVNLGYGNVERFFDREIDAEHYNTLSNVTAIIGVWTYDDGSARPYCENYTATLVRGAAQIDAFEGRTGVMDLTASTSYLQLPSAALPTDVFTFETWVYVKEWTEGAYIVQRELATANGFSIRLGTDGNIIARLNGTDTVIATGKKEGEWFHVGVSSDELGSVVMKNVDNIKPTLGKNLKGYLDETLIWSSNRNQGTRKADAETLPYPGPAVSLSPSTFYQMRACYDYEKSDDPGFDRYSCDGFLDYMRSFTKGMRGAKFILSAAAPSDLDGTLKDETKREKMATEIAEIVNSPYVDGIDFDFEWTYNSTVWDCEGDLARRVREKVGEDKIVSVSIGSWSCGLPAKYLPYIDFITCQQYGNQRDRFTYSTYKNEYNTFIGKGLTKDKLLLSYATTTSAGFKDDVWAKAPQGYRYVYNDSFTDDTDSFEDSDGNQFSFTGVNQTQKRASFVNDNDVCGIFYWDIGNDLAASNKASLARNAAYYVNANVETLVESVDKAACAPADDELCPYSTDDPEDQGGGEEEAKTITMLSQLEDGVAYNIINANGMGIIYADRDNENVWLGESSNSNYSGTVDHYSSRALWLVIKHESKYYLYNCHNEQFVTIPAYKNASFACALTDSVASVTVTAKNGNFFFREHTDDNRNYMCASPQISGKPVCQWTTDDSGAQWKLTTAPLFSAKEIYQRALYKIDPATGIEEREVREVGEVRGVREAFNLAGQRVGNDYKGIVVLGGKKMFEK